MIMKTLKKLRELSNVLRNRENKSNLLSILVNTIAILQLEFAWNF